MRQRGVDRAGSWPGPGRKLSCGRPSSRGHDRYRRQLQDVPLAARPVRIVLDVRRFVCMNTECGQRTFAEQIPGFTSLFACVADRLGVLLDGFVLVLAGCAGARMVLALGITAGWVGGVGPDWGDARSVVWHSARAGGGDFEIKRGHLYATVLTDGETHSDVDVLPTRDTAPLTTWLLAHPRRRGRVS
nr:transposase family protein [Streptomyces montanus]